MRSLAMGLLVLLGSVSESPAARSVSVIIDGETYSCQKGNGDGAGAGCVCREQQEGLSTFIALYERNETRNYLWASKAYYDYENNKRIAAKLACAQQMREAFAGICLN